MEWNFLSIPKHQWYSTVTLLLRYPGDPCHVSILYYIFYLFVYIYVFIYKYMYHTMLYYLACICLIFTSQIVVYFWQILLYYLFQRCSLDAFCWTSWYNIDDLRSQFAAFVVITRYNNQYINNTCCNEVHMYQHNYYIGDVTNQSAPMFSHSFSVQFSSHNERFKYHGERHKIIVMSFFKTQNIKYWILKRSGTFEFISMLND